MVLLGTTLHGPPRSTVPRLPAIARLILRQGVNLFLVLFKKIRDVEKGVPLQAQIDEGRLHARKHARHPAFVNTAGQRIFVRPLKINFNQLILF
jgi:hypothetical protein